MWYTNIGTDNVRDPGVVKCLLFVKWAIIESQWTDHKEKSAHMWRVHMGRSTIPKTRTRPVIERRRREYRGAEGP